MEDGWIKLHRKIKKNWLYTEPRKFSRLEAWLDLLLMANYTTKEVCMNGEVSHIERGSFITSIKKLEAAWGWSNRKVKMFLDLLADAQMIVHKSDKRKTFISIVNYCLYQDDENQKASQIHHESTTDSSQIHTTKKEKKDNTAPKISCGDFVTMTNAEYEKLCGTYGEEDTRRMIEALDNYKGATGRKYKSDYRAILSWVVDKVFSSRRPSPTPKARAYKDEKDKCPLCRDSGWIVDEDGEMIRCSCQGGEMHEASSQ